jgi:hypothetical protein
MLALAYPSPTAVGAPVFADLVPYLTTIARPERLSPEVNDIFEQVRTLFTFLRDQMRLAAPNNLG